MWCGTQSSGFQDEDTVEADDGCAGSLGDKHHCGEPYSWVRGLNITPPGIVERAIPEDRTAEYDFC